MVVSRSEVYKVNSLIRALRREEKKFLRQMEDARQQLETVREAVKLLSGGKATGKKKRFVSTAVRAKMAKAQKERWRKIKSKSA